MRVERLGEGEGLRGMQVGGAGQAEMLRVSLGRGTGGPAEVGEPTSRKRESCGEGRTGGLGRGVNDVKVSGVAGKP
jgi:hypothetical protein